MADSYSLKAILSAVDKLSPVLKGVQGVAKSTKKYLGDLGSTLNYVTSKFGVPLGIVSTIAAGFGVAAIKKAVVDFADLGEEVQKGALKAGMSNAEYQKMKYVFDQAGVPVEAMQGSLGKLNKNIGAAASGKNKDLASLFQALHIPMKGLNGQIRTGAEMLPQLADAFVKNKDPVKQAAIGTALFGKAYQEMLPLLNEGSESIEKSLARFNRLKGVIGDDDLKGAKEFGDQLKDLSFVTKGFQMTIAKELVPVLSPLLEQFIQWAAVNKKLIAGEVKKVVQELVAAVKSVNWGVFVQGIRDVAASIGGAITWVGGLRNALIILALIMNAQTIFAIFGVVGAFGRLGLATAGLLLKIPMVGAALASVGTWLMAAGRAVLLFSRALLLSPLGIVLAIAAAAFLIYENWDTLKAWFNTFVDWMSGKWSNLLLAVGPLGVIAKAITDNWEPLKTWFSGLFDWMGQKFGWAADLAGGIGRAVSGIFGAGGPGAPAAASAGALLPSTPTTAQGALGSGTVNLNAPTTATLNGKLDISFKDAPPGMRVEQAKADGPRVAMNTNVGYRSFATGMP